MREGEHCSLFSLIHTFFRKIRFVLHCLFLGDILKNVCYVSLNRSMLLFQSKSGVETMMCFHVFCVGNQEMADIGMKLVFTEVCLYNQIWKEGL